MQRDSEQTETGGRMNTKQKRALRIGGICLGGICICIGILRGECGVILQKAVKICLEGSGI